jgi:uncharacterized phiE125 gp8 family phage protein
MDIRRTSDPLTLEAKLNVVSVMELKLHCRVIDDDENILFSQYIEAAFDHLHGPNGWLNGYCLLKERFEFYLDSYLSWGLEIPLRPFVLLVNFDYLGSDGVTYGAVTADRYRQITFGEHGVIKKTTLPLPYYGTYHPRAYRLRFDAGHSAAAEVPSPLRMAIKMLAAHYYQNREVTSIEKGSKIAYGLESLAGRYRISPDHS